MNYYAKYLPNYFPCVHIAEEQPISGRRNAVSLLAAKGVLTSSKVLMDYNPKYWLQMHQVTVQGPY